MLNTGHSARVKIPFDFGMVFFLLVTDRRLLSSSLH